MCMFWMQQWLHSQPCGCMYMPSCPAAGPRAAQAALIAHPTCSGSRHQAAHTPPHRPHLVGLPGAGALWEHMHLQRTAQRDIQGAAVACGVPAGPCRNTTFSQL